MVEGSLRNRESRFNRYSQVSILLVKESSDRVLHVKRSFVLTSFFVTPSWNSGMDPGTDYYMTSNLSDVIPLVV